MGAELLKLLLVSAVVMGMSHTIAKERVFQPLRDKLGGKERWAGYMISCPYCVSHYLAFVLVPLFRVYPLHVAVRWGLLNGVLDWFFASILVTVVAAFLRVLFWFVDEAQALVRKKKTLEEVETETAIKVRDQLEAGERHHTPGPH